MESDEKACPLCGETIKKVAVRCKHCHADLKEAEAADFDRGKAMVKKDPAPLDAGDFEQRFLSFAYQTSSRIDAASVAFALRVPIKEAEEKLEDLAARDVLVRHVDEEGFVYYRLPGRQSAIAPRPTNEPAPAISPGVSPHAMAGLLLNLVIPGAGTIVTGRTVEGVLQLVLLVVSLPLCFVLIGFPLLFATWAWALASGIRALNEGAAAASAAQPPRQLPPAPQPQRRE
jgi:TM2 domain-containing membrane protein YozV